MDLAVLMCYIEIKEKMWMLYLSNWNYLQVNNFTNDILAYYLRYICKNRCILIYVSPNFILGAASFSLFNFFNFFNFFIFS